MREFLSIMATLLSLAASAVQANADTPWGVSFRTASNEAMPMKSADALHNPPIVSSRQSQVPLRLAAVDKNGDSRDKDVKEPESASGDDIDLRYVDRDKVKAGEKIANGNGDKGANGEGDKEDAERKDDENKDGEKNDEGGGGFDRLWDVPKLG